MRIAIALLFCFLGLYGHSQTHYFIIRLPHTFLGTTNSLKSGMDNAHYNQTSFNGGWFGPASVTYPKAVKYPSVYGEWGTLFKENRSLSLSLGIEEPGKVDGWNGTDHVSIHHAGYVLNPKMNFHNPTSTFSIGPALMLLHYGHYTPATTIDKSSKLIPGLTLSVASNTSKEKKFRVGAFATLNLYTSTSILLIPAKGQAGPGFQSNVNSSNAQVGLLFHFKGA